MDDLLIGEEQPTQPTGEERARRRRLWVTAAIVALSLFGLTNLATNALFTDSDTAGANAFTAGTVDIATTNASSALSATNLAPGDKVFAPIVVDNPGSLQLRYAVTGVASDPDGKELAGQLKLRIWRVPSATQCTAPGTRPLAPLASVSGLSTSETPVIGDRGAGADPGDRTLSSGVAETLCVRVDLPLTTGNAFQAATTSMTLRFLAEQTANN